MNSPEHQDDERMDQAVAERLGKLASFPVNTSNLERALRRAMAQDRPMVLRLLKPIGAIAATLILAATIVAVILMSSSGEVLASPAQMAQFHQDIVENRVPVMRVDSIE